jgi:hypothetical protein
MSVVFPFKSSKFNKAQRPPIVKPTVPTVPAVVKLVPAVVVVKPILPPIVNSTFDVVPPVNPTLNTENIDTSVDSDFVYKKSNQSCFSSATTTIYKVKI